MKVGAASAIKLAWLVVDFDGTCTVRDTTPTIACLAAAHNSGGVEQLSSFGVHERDYMEGHARLLGGGELEAEPSAAVDVAALSAFLAALDDHSTRTTREVSRSGVLAGLDGARVAETFTAWAAGEVVGQLAPQPPPSLQPGCAAALAAAAAAGCRLGVLSVNWCPALIHALLAPPLGADAPAAETLTVAPPYELWCNSLAPDGRVRLAVAGAAQKARKIDGLVRAARRDGGGGAVACVLSPRMLIRAIRRNYFLTLRPPIPQVRWRLGDRPDRAPRRRRWHPRRHLRVCAAHRPPLWRQTRAAARGTARAAHRRRRGRRR